MALIKPRRDVHARPWPNAKWQQVPTRPDSYIYLLTEPAILTSSLLFILVYLLFYLQVDFPSLRFPFTSLCPESFSRFSIFHRIFHLPLYFLSSTRFSVFRSVLCLPLDSPSCSECSHHPVVSCKVFARVCCLLILNFDFHSQSYFNELPFKFISSLSQTLQNSLPI